MSTGTENNKLLTVRDPSGFKPLCIGTNEQGIAVASESCALDICGFKFSRDVKPGEVVQIEDGRITYNETVLPPGIKNTGLCIFEYVYLARADSFIDNMSVYEARVNMGRILAREANIEADAVCGLPDSGLDAALGYSLESGIPLVPGFVRNRYIGRTFIYPTQSMRENAVKLKFNPLKLNIEGKRIILVDDSIVRGTSTGKTVRELKRAGAREVHMLVASPPIKLSCSFGCIDRESEENIIANNMSIEKICETIGADSLNYISIEGLKQACGKCVLPLCLQCFACK
jgi:amidophosphoribosyltransferase